MTTLLVATHGGHVDEMIALRGRIHDLGDVEWVTNDHPQTRGLLEGEKVHWVPLIDSRDVLGVARALPAARRLLRSRRYERVVSTGSAIALAYLPMAALLRIPAHYLESSTRVDAPSVSGKLLARIPRVTTWWAYADPPSGWRRFDGLYAHYSSERFDEANSVTSMVVTVGTTDYCFRRLIERLVEVTPPTVDVFWQVGGTDVTGLDIESHTVVDGDELARRIDKADVVVTHAGAGSLVRCLEAGKVPVYVPRLGAQNEQIDDHQVELARWAGAAGIAVSVDASELTWADVERAAGLRAIAAPPSSIDLEAP